MDSWRQPENRARRIRRHSSFREATSSRFRGFEHPLWGELWAPRDLPELVAVAADPHWGPDMLDGWRGQASINWPLHSGAVRRLQQPPAWGGTCSDVTEERVRMYESQLLDNARLAGHGHVDGRRLNDLELLTVLQHHGAAPRTC